MFCNHLWIIKQYKLNDLMYEYQVQGLGGQDYTDKQ